MSKSEKLIVSAKKTISFIFLFLPMAVWAEFPEPVIEWNAKITSTGDASPVPYPRQKPDSVLVAVPGRVARIDGTGNVLFDVSIESERDRETRGTYHFDASVA
ncbi:MAG: hypothetical protein ABIH23_23985, partial [bacterium]